MILLNKRKNDCVSNRSCGKGIYDFRNKSGFNKRFLQKSAPNRYSKKEGGISAEIK